MGQLKAYRTGVQPLYHGKQLIIRTSGFDGHLNFNNVNTQFEWIVISIQPVFSKEHRNTFSTHGNEQASNAIQKVEITNIIDPYPRVNEKIYNLNKFDNQVLLYRQYCTYILNSSSTKTMLDFSLSKEVQQATLGNAWRYR